MTILTGLLNHTQEGIDLLKVHYTLDTKCPGTVFCGIFAGSTKPGMKLCSGSALWECVGGGA